MVIIIILLWFLYPQRNGCDRGRCQSDAGRRADPGRAGNPHPITEQRGTGAGGRQREYRYRDKRAEHQPCRGLLCRH